MKVGIVGPGALGGSLAALWSQKGIPLFLLHPLEERVQNLRQQGILLEEKGSSQRVFPPAFTYKELKELPDLWILTVKAPFLKEVAKTLSHIAPSVPVVSLLNGLGLKEILRQFYPEEKILLGVTFLAAFRKASQHICLKARGVTYFPSHPLSQRVLFLFQQIGLPVEIVPNIEHWIWKKAVVNAILNPLTAILNIPNGALLHPIGEKLVLSLFEEIFSLIQREGLPLSKEELCDFLFKAIRETKENYSSMWQDIRSKKPTELAFLTGAFLKKARQHNHSTPLLQFTHHLVQFLEGKNHE